MPWRGARFGLEATASCSKTNVYEKSIRYGDAAVGRCDPAHSGPDPGADPQVVGRRELRVRARALARTRCRPYPIRPKWLIPTSDGGCCSSMVKTSLSVGNDCRSPRALHCLKVAFTLATSSCGFLKRFFRVRRAS